MFTEAHERQSVVITTNLEFCRWGAVFGDDRMAAVVIDRIVHHGSSSSSAGSPTARKALMQEGQVLKNAAHPRCANRSKKRAIPLKSY